MKIYRYFVLIFIILGICASWYSAVLRFNAANSEYENNLKLARQYAEQGITVEAENYYNKVIDERQDLKIVQEFVDYEIKYSSKNKVKKVIHEFQSKYSNQPWTFEIAIIWALDQDDMKYAIEEYRAAKKAKVESDYLTKFFNDYEYQFELVSTSYEKVSDFDSENIAVVENKDGSQAVNEKGMKISSEKFSAIGTTNDGLIPVLTTGAAPYFIDVKGQKNIVAENLDYSQLGTYSKLGFPAYDLKTGLWQFLKNDFSPVFDSSKAAGGSHQTVSSLVSQIAAVKDGESWKIVNSETGEDVCQKTFKNVILSENGDIGKNGLFFAEDSDLALYDQNCEKKTNFSISDARIFVADLGAVKVGEKWGFVNSEGKMVINEQFDDAKSFKNDLAAVKVGEKWGYIDSSGSFKIEPQFSQAFSFSDAGTAFVEVKEEKKNTKSVKFLKLNKYEMERE